MSDSDYEMVSSDPEDAEDFGSARLRYKTWTHYETNFMLQKYYQFMDQVGPGKQFPSKNKMLAHIAELLLTNYEFELSADQVKGRFKTLQYRRRKNAARFKSLQHRKRTIAARNKNVQAISDETLDADETKQSEFEFEKQMQKIEARAERIEARTKPTKGSKKKYKKNTLMTPVKFEFKKIVKYESKSEVMKTVKYEQPSPSKYQQPSSSPYQQPSHSPYQQPSPSPYQKPPPQIIQISLPRQSFNTSQFKPSASSGYERPAEPSSEDLGQRSLADVIRKTWLEIDDRKALRMKQQMDFMRELFSNK